jgi:hypothetical protein
MKSSIALPCFVKDSLVDVLYLNRLSLEFNCDCIIEESEKDDVPQNHISSVCRKSCALIPT